MLIKSTTTNNFDLNEVSRGTLIKAKHKTWTSAEMGIVTSATEREITVSFLPTIANVTNHFFIYADEVANGKWEISYTNDMETISKYPADTSTDDTSGTATGGDTP